MAEQHALIRNFRASAPYINAHRNKVFVLMLGGDALAHPNFANVVHDIALLHSLGIKLVLVHGARPQIEQRLKTAGIDSVLHNGMRVTNQSELQIVTEVAGALRAQFEALLSMGLANSPMHGADISVCSGNFVRAKPLGVVDGVDFHHTGQVRRIQTETINQLLQQQQIVLLSPLGYSATGEVFNLTPEEIAQEAAVALKADKLLMFTDQQGLEDENGVLLRECELDQARSLLDSLQHDELSRCMQALISATERGVPRCHVLSYAEDGALLTELFSRDGSGTLLASDHYEQLLTANIDHVGGILEIIEPLEQTGELVKRSRERLENEIERFYVIERDGMVVACAALYPSADNTSGEIACVATHPEYRGADRGERLLHALEAQAKKIGLARVFLLTTRTAHWWLEQGFAAIDVDDLPGERKQLYNYQRNAKVFSKSL